MKKHPYRRYEYYTMPADAPMDAKALGAWLGEHKIDSLRLRYLRDLYEGRHPILLGEEKPSWKPDNRIIINFAKYIVDTLCGYFIGIPAKTTSPDAQVQTEITSIRDRCDMDDSEAELAKICSIYGSGLELCYLDESAQVCITYLTPLEGFIIYDDSVERRPLYGVRYYLDRQNVLRGTLYSRTEMVDFISTDGLHLLEGTRRFHSFDGVPLVEYLENEERSGAFEGVESAITAYEKAISEKANDVDAFADAYMLIKGLGLEPEDLFHIRQDRVIQVKPMDADMLAQVDVSFLSRPSGDTTQENLLDRLEKQIFAVSMVANISDEEFGGSSGTALAYKLLPMQNLAKLKARKFASGMNQRWRLVASLPTTHMAADAWESIEYRFTQNAPRNLLEEAQTASQLAGITSKKTQLSIVSAVQDVAREMAEIEMENADAADAYRAERGGMTEAGNAG